MSTQPGSTSHYPAAAVKEEIVRRTLSVVVDNEPGVLARVIGLFSGRGYNIDSLTVSETEHEKHLSRITIATTGTPMVIEQIKHQLERLVPVQIDSQKTAAPAGPVKEGFKPMATASGRDSRILRFFADPAANPYLALAALLMAGLDGVERRIDPGEAMDRNLYDLPPEEVDELPTVCRTLAEALDALDRDRDFLIAGEVFTDDLIDAYIALKRAEIEAIESVPHPVEFQLYYSV